MMHRHEDRRRDAVILQTSMGVRERGQTRQIRIKRENGEATREVSAEHTGIANIPRETEALETTTGQGGC